MSERYQPRVMLVTGGAGFIGSNFIFHVMAHWPQLRVINLDALTYAGDRANLIGLETDARYQFVQGDICDREMVSRILSDHQVDTVVHFAAESHVDRSITGPAAFLKTNIEGTAALLEAARDCWARLSPAVRDGQRRYHHISTDEVYGSLSEAAAPFTEDTPYAPNSPYSASKAASDHLVRAWHHTYGLPVTSSCCSNNYGPRQHAEKLIPTVIRHAVAGAPIPVYGDGLNVRDWIHVDDHCAAIVSILQAGRLGTHYNVGAANEVRNLDLVRTICRLLDELRPTGTEHAQLITFVTDRPGHDRRYAVDSARIRAHTGWQPHRLWEQALRDTVAWYLANPGRLATPR